MRGWSISDEERQRDCSSEEKALGGVGSHQCVQISEESAEKAELRFFSVVPTGRTRDNEWAQTEAWEIPSE